MRKLKTRENFAEWLVHKHAGSQEPEVCQATWAVFSSGLMRCV